MSLPRCSMSTKISSVHAPLPLAPGALKMDLSLAVADSSWNQLDVDAWTIWIHFATKKKDRN